VKVLVCKSSDALKGFFFKPPRAAQVPGTEAASGRAEGVALPLFGTRSLAAHQRSLGLVLGASLFALFGAAVFALGQSDTTAQQLGATGQALMQSQRLAKSVTHKLWWESPQAFVDVNDSAEVLVNTVRGLQVGDDGQRLLGLGAEAFAELDRVVPLVERAEKNAKLVLEQQRALTQIGAALRLINRQSADLLDTTKAISALKQRQNAPLAEVSAVAELLTLTQRIGKSSNEFLTLEGASPETVFLLGKDLNSFQEIARALLDGNPDLRLQAATDFQTREQLTALIQMYEETRVQAAAILGNLQELLAAREAQLAILEDSEPCAETWRHCRATLLPVPASMA